MAFQQQQARPQPQRFTSLPQVDTVQPKLSPRKRTIEDSQEWILFSPHAETASRTATSQTPRTATQLSDFGSLETHIRSQVRDGNDGGDNVGTEYDDENEELDSLDDGLHAFHHPFSSSSLNQLDQSGGSVLPTHDGLGTFSAPGMQHQMWQFEKYNPHRRRGMVRKSSLQQRIDDVEEELELDVEDERMTRIEQWRIEQSRAVLEEIEKETRRRKRKLGRMGISKSVDHRSESAMESSIGDIRPTTAPPQSAPAPPTESWWARITRRVIREIIGIDDTTLSVIFGQSTPDASPTPTQSSPIAEAVATESRVTFNDPNYSWELRLLERIARELGILANAIPHDHEGAFNTYNTTGENTISVPVRDLAPRQPSLRQQRRRMLAAAPSDIAFSPTLLPGPLSPSTEADKSLWGIEEEPEEVNANNSADQAEQQHWERDIDLPAVFTYLRNHFSQPTQPEQNAHEDSGPLPASWATDQQTSIVSALGTSPESLARAETIRRQHPLVHRAAERAAAQHRRRESMLRKHQMSALLQRPRGSSCASHSTKRSRRTISGGSSRHYWDIGGGPAGSVDSEAAFSSGAGNWGEV